MTEISKLKKLKVFGLLIALFLITSLGLSILVSALAYPTDSHRETAAKIADLSDAAFKSGDFDAMGSPEFKALNEHPNTEYSNMVTGIGTAAQLALWIATIVIAYRYIRKHRLLKNPVWIIAAAEAVAAVASVLPNELFLRAYAGVSSVFAYEFPYVIFTLGMTFVMSMLLTAVVAKIADWQYNRTHGFVEA